MGTAPSPMAAGGVSSKCTGNLVTRGLSARMIRCSLDGQGTQAAQQDVSRGLDSAKSLQVALSLHPDQSQWRQRTELQAGKTTHQAWRTASAA